MRRGATLIELIITIFLLGFVIYLIASVLYPAIRWTAIETVRTHLEEASSIAFLKMANDLERSAPAGVSVYSDQSGPTEPVILACQRIESAEPVAARQIWETRLVVYYWDRGHGSLYRKEWPPDPPALGETPTQHIPMRLAPGALLRVANTTNGTERLVANDVELFAIDQDADEPYVSQPLRITLVLRKGAIGSAEDEVVAVTRSLCLRNSL